MYVPPSTKASLPVYFSVDKYNFENDTAGGKNEFHGTAQIVHQQSSANVVSNKFLIDRNQNRANFPQSQNQTIKSILSLLQKKGH